MYYKEMDFQERILRKKLKWILRTYISQKKTIMDIKDMYFKEKTIMDLIHKKFIMDFKQKKQ